MAVGRALEIVLMHLVAQQKCKVKLQFAKWCGRAESFIKGRKRKLGLL